MAPWIQCCWTLQGIQALLAIPLCSFATYQQVWSIFLSARRLVRVQLRTGDAASRLLSSSYVLPWFGSLLTAAHVMSAMCRMSERAALLRLCRISDSRAEMPQGNSHILQTGQWPTFDVFTLGTYASSLRIGIGCPLGECEPSQMTRMWW
mmetsp:Transcript_67587/g.219995  ORF Transcript_67587/g.219995 Transcript_67587/m.219995 type:complete len:150 (+) Transcript_67587:163-612(+)